MNRYIEHIIKDLVRDTRIDYDDEEIHFLPLPHLFLPPPNPPIPSLPPPPLLNLPTLHFPSFSDYCKENYGLTKDEIDYVWKEYKNIIIDKLENNEI